MQLKSRQTRVLALLTGGVIAATTFFQPAPARADKSDTYKYGAIGLGVLGAVLATKGKTLPAAAAVAGGYYAYKKGRDADREEDRSDRRPRHSSYPNYYGGNSYGGYNSYSNSGYNRDDRFDNRRDKSDRFANGHDNRRSDRNNYDLSPYLR